MQQPIDVACAFDRAMAIPALIVAASIRQTMSPGRHVTFHALATDKRALKKSAAGRRLNSQFFDFRTLFVPRSELIKVDLSESFMTSQASLVRLSLPHLVNDTERIIYLDSDVIVHRPLDELFDLDIGGYALAACPDYGMMIFARDADPLGVHKRSLGFKSEPASYFNSGVLLFDCLEWRARLYSEKCRATAAHSEPSFFADQDLLNIVVQSGYQKLDPRWNAFARHAEITSDGPEALAVSLAVADPWITHFSGSPKPWLPQKSTPAINRFWNVAHLSPFRREAYSLWGRSRRRHAARRVVKLPVRKIAEFFLTLSRGVAITERLLSKKVIVSMGIWRFGEALYRFSLMPLSKQEETARRS